MVPTTFIVEIPVFIYIINLCTAGGLTTARLVGRATIVKNTLIRPLAVRCPFNPHRPPITSDKRRGEVVHNVNSWVQNKKI